MKHDDAASDERRKDDTERKGDCAIDDQPIYEPISVLYRPGSSELAKCQRTGHCHGDT